MGNNKPTVVCKGCGQEKIEAARGLCRTCYSRWRENGTVEYVRDFRERMCSVEGCDRRAHGQGLCTLHLQRLRRTGTTEPGRRYEMKRSREDMRSLEDLYPIWREFSRPSNPRPVFKLWRENYEAFKSAVGKRPSKRHRLLPVDRTKMLGPDNWEWREQLVVKQEGESNAEYDARHRLARRELNGSAMWDSDLRRKYGADFGLAQLRKMAEAQDHKCAICGQPETELRNGVVRHLAVDHNHFTGAIRALLCQRCNKGIGTFGDDVDLMLKAIAYLRHHEALQRT